MIEFGIPIFFQDYEVVTEITLTDIEEVSGDCDSCKNSVNKLFTDFRSESLIDTMTNFTEIVCPVINNQTTDCKEKVINWWPIIAQIIYSEEAAVLVCEELDPECEHK